MDGRHLAPAGQREFPSRTLAGDHRYRNSWCAGPDTNHLVIGLVVKATHPVPEPTISPCSNQRSFSIRATRCLPFRKIQDLSLPSFRSEPDGPSTRFLIGVSCVSIPSSRNTVGSWLADRMLYVVWCYFVLRDVKRKRRWSAG
jgi:hypothetical protein